MKKRYFISTLLGTIVMLATIAGCGSDSGSPSSSTPDEGNGKTKSYLFVQNASSGTFVSNGDDSYTLTLKGISEQTVYFSDRPQRDAGQVSTKRFVEGSCFNSKNPPNAAIDVMEGNESSDLVVVELLDPRYDAAKKSLQYTVRIIAESNLSTDSFNKRADALLPEEFGAAAVFIDSCPDRTVQCSNYFTYSSDEVIVAGSVNCCQCFDWDTLDCRFKSDCCSFERCQKTCISTYGSDFRSVSDPCGGGWSDNADDWDYMYWRCKGEK